MASVSEFLTRTRGAQDGSARLHWTDWASYGYLVFGIFLPGHQIVRLCSLG
jgi:alpha-1,4-digalacturonate transport system permease protein